MQSSHFTAGTGFSEPPTSKKDGIASTSHSASSTVLLSRCDELIAHAQTVINELGEKDNQLQILVDTVIGGYEALKKHKKDLSSAELGIPTQSSETKPTNLSTTSSGTDSASTTSFVNLISPGERQTLFAGKSCHGFDFPVSDWVTEPEGSLDLHWYSSVGIKILNLKHIAIPGSGMVGEVPCVVLDINNPDVLCRAIYATSKLRNEYSIVIYRSGRQRKEWVGEAGVARAKTLLEQDRTIGYQSRRETPKRSILLQQTIREYKKSNATPRTYIKQDTNLPEKDGLYLICSEDAERTLLKKDKNLATVVWENDSFSGEQRIEKEEHPQPYVERLSLLSEETRESFLQLPRNMMRFNGPSSQYYASGLDANKDGKSMLDVIGHPDARVLDQLPFGLAFSAMWSRITKDGRLLTDMDYKEIHEWTRGNDGILATWGYAGNTLSLFAYHEEDAYIPSANLSAAGADKMWMTLPARSVRLLDTAMTEIAESCFPFHRGTFIHPRFLIRHNIPFHIARQQVGDLVLTAPGSAHQGWNTGRNLNAAVNFADTSSIEYTLTQFFEGDLFRHPCVCRVRTTNGEPRPRVRFVNLSNKSHSGSTIARWLAGVRQFCGQSDKSALSSTDADVGRAVNLWRWLILHKRSI